MHVSFVIPLFNCLSLTQAMLRSLDATVPKDLTYEIILVDDGSTDGTREWLHTLPLQRYKILLNAENVGYAASNNRGAAVATGQYLALLNNDLVLTEGWLEPMLQLQRDLPRPGAIGNVQWCIHTDEIDHAGIFINAKGKPQHDRRPPFWLESTRVVTAVTGACFLINRDLWNQVAGFDEHYINGGEDVDLCLRLATHRCTNAVALNSRIYHHVSASPGRKRRDEENTRRLTERWRDELALQGAVSWCREYVARELNAATGFSKPAASARIFAYAAGIASSPPPEAISGMQFAIDRELDRWRRMFG